ncbi:putative inactive group IIC secretory phospholipase A2 [Tenrec ecaudatus]|uniref:putative inactive group IIC secretory phospholipase A2 n=1 Tax=Tenrec ecaudatus TaxID=94439 RepID=UPI003F59205D
MKVITMLVIFTSCLVAPTQGSFWQFQRMVKHIMGQSAFFSYYRYGCYCGLGGKGTPVDGTDRVSSPLGKAGGYALGPGVGCPCGLGACECDRQPVHCFRESLPTYEKHWKQFFPSASSSARLASGPP